MDSVATSPAQRWALCSLLCLCLFTAGLLLGSRPFFPTPRPWEHFSRAQKLAPSAPRPASPRAAAAYNDHQVVAPAPDAGSTDLGREEQEDDDDKELPLGSAPAPAPAWEDGDGEGRECDLLDGRWVHDPAGYPLYQAAECPFLSDQVTCRRNGRPDAGYEQWRWQPTGCSARFRATEALDQCQNKRLVFVGDSKPQHVGVARLHHLHGAARPVADAHRGRQLRVQDLPRHCTSSILYSITHLRLLLVSLITTLQFFVRRHEMSACIRQNLFRNFLEF
uniref:Uncharacterized protein n=1 Tax=Avena sativa TaxID=4498 RepID=A0ACD5VQH8_AVESA